MLRGERPGDLSILSYSVNTRQGDLVVLMLLYIYVCVCSVKRTGGAGIFFFPLSGGVGNWGKNII